MIFLWRIFLCYLFIEQQKVSKFEAHYVLEMLQNALSNEKSCRQDIKKKKKKKKKKCKHFVDVNSFFIIYTAYTYLHGINRISYLSLYIGQSRTKNMFFLPEQKIRRKRHARTRAPAHQGVPVHVPTSKKWRDATIAAPSPSAWSQKVKMAPDAIFSLVDESRGRSHTHNCQRGLVISTSPCMIARTAASTSSGPSAGPCVSRRPQVLRHPTA